MIMEVQNKPMAPAQFCPLCAKRGKKTKILPLSINLSVGVSMCISVKCTYPFGEYVITELQPPTGQELSKIIQEVAEENKGITDEDIISSVENRQIAKIDENVYFPDIDDSFILQQLNQQLDTGISEYPNTYHLVDNESLAGDSIHILNDTVEEISISAEFDQQTQKPFSQKNMVVVNMPNTTEPVQDMNVDVSDFSNTNNLDDSETLVCDVKHILPNTVEQKNMVVVNMPNTMEPVQDMNVDVSDFSNTNYLDDSETLVCDVKHILPNTVEQKNIATEFNQPTQRIFNQNTPLTVRMRKKRKATVLTSPNNPFHGNGEPDFLNKITEQYMGDVSNFADFVKSSFRGTPSECCTAQRSESENTEQIMLEDIATIEDDAPNNHKSTEQVVKPPEKVLESIAKDVQSNAEIVQPIEKVVHSIPEIVQPIEKVVHSIPEIVQPIEKVVQSTPEIVQPIEKAFSIVVPKDEKITQPFSIVVQKNEKVTQPFSIVVQKNDNVTQPFSINVQNVENIVEPITEKVVQSLERVVLTKAKAAQLQGKVNILKKKKKSLCKSNLDMFVEESDSDLEIVEIPKVPNKNKKFESNLKLLSLSRRHTVLKRSSSRVSSGPTRFL